MVSNVATSTVPSVSVVPVRSPFLPSDEPLCMRIPLTAHHYLELRCLYPPVVAPAPVPAPLSLLLANTVPVEAAPVGSPPLPMTPRKEIRKLGQSGAFELFETVAPAPRQLVIRVGEVDLAFRGPHKITRCQFTISVPFTSRSLQVVVFYPSRAALYVVVKTQDLHELTQIFTVSPYQNHADDLRGILLPPRPPPTPDVDDNN